jgi:predicted exporter
MARALIGSQILALGFVGILFGVFLGFAAQASPETLTAMAFLIAVLALGMQFGLKQWSFLQIQAPFLIGLGLGILLALGKIF